MVQTLAMYGLTSCSTSILPRISLLVHYLWHNWATRLSSPSLYSFFLWIFLGICDLFCTPFEKQNFSVERFFRSPLYKYLYYWMQENSREDASKNVVGFFVFFFFFPSSNLSTNGFGSIANFTTILIDEIRAQTSAISVQVITVVNLS